ncbi:hypothetical protein Dvina_01855 [Dactylosporangium vinaceum]|uniref:Uncharacterized protein n=1 Tax=Dactylosporangium vinaceum TaxID=53362 RepID=A0ABV5MLF7_9ACTN|nr:hypothetical protein [Dactylosporangium vinaceum]UAB96982.1 hypothetical protein Dvina_01855 [Dactylosporangium vinaceum]
MLYRRPFTPVGVDIEPELASWDKSGSPGQHRLATWLQEVDRIAARVPPVPGPVAVALDVALPPATPLGSGGRDLDNFLLPVVQRLGARTVTAAFATKRYRPTFALAIEPASAATEPVGSMHLALLRGSSESSAWKHRLRQSLIDAEVAEVPAGPVWLTAAIATWPGRVWTNLWKPLIDSLGPILGERAANPFNAFNDRIVDLGLHHQLDTSLEHDVRLQLWWGPMPPA